MTDPRAGRWTDLQTRVVSAVVMVVVGAGAVWAGGGLFSTLVVVLTGVMLWELATFVTKSSMKLSRDHLPTVIYAFAIVLAGYGLVNLRHDLGAAAILWLIGTVVASDVLGYFVGRSLGGAKFWPAISPKKTWSGTVAGWAGAALIGLAFVLFGTAGWGLVLLSPIVGFAGQIGDIAESWLKRRSGVKDSSHLIPGHGGVLDRFDAMIGAVLAVMALGVILPLPLPAGN